MFGKVTPERAFFFTSTMARIGACVPPPTTARNFQITLYEFYWWFCLCLSLSLSLPIVYDLYLNGNDVNCILLNLAELCPVCTGTLKLVLCKLYAKTIQACVSDIESVLRSANVWERGLLQSYVDRCVGLYSFLLFCVVMTIFGFDSSHIYLPQPYPTHSSFPFEVNTESLKNSLRGLQMVSIAQAGLLVAIDLEFTSLIWYSAARFELLSNQLQRASEAVQLRICIKRHQEIMQFAEDVNLVIRFIAYGVGLSTAIGTISGGIQFLRDVSLITKLRFVSFVAVGIIELFLYSWPAEHLTQASEDIGFSIYCSRWVGQSPEIAGLLIIMMQRVKKPAVISIGGLAPALSLNFYGSFLTTSFSYFTTLRATTTTSES